MSGRAVLPNARDKLIVMMVVWNIYKLRQVAASVFAVLSLCVSSVSACACAHHSHPEKVEVKTPSCHRQAHTEEAASQPAVTDSADASCECILQAAPKVYVKHENFKVGKQAIAVTQAGAAIELAPVCTPITSAGFYSPLAFISGDFHNLTPGRAPPRL